jgi:hypothetical protein
MLSGFRAAMPTTRIRCNANFLSLTGAIPSWNSLFTFCQTNKIDVGGPDPDTPVTGSPPFGRPISANTAFRGDNGGTDWRGTVPWNSEIEGLGFSTGVTLSQVWAYETTYMKPSHMDWVWYSVNGNSSNAQVIAFVNSIGGAVPGTLPY